MPRDITPAVAAALAGPNPTLVTLLNLFIEDARFDFTDNGHDVRFGKNTWRAAEYLLKVGSVKLTSQVRVNTLTVSFSATADDIVGAVLNNNYIDGRFIIRRAVLVDGTIVPDPIQIFRGPIAEWKRPQRGGSSQLQITASSHWVNFDVRAGRKTNSKSQQAMYPGDTGFDLAAESRKNIKWGS